MRRRLIYILKHNAAIQAIYRVVMGILFLPESTEGVKEGQITAMDYENEEKSTENSAEMVEK